MVKDKIEQNPSFEKLRNEGKDLQKLVKLKPILSALGVDTSEFDEASKKIGNLSTQIQKMTEVPDKFNDLFVDLGWIFFESMELDVADKAISIAESEGLEKAEEYLASHFSAIWFEQRINFLKYIHGFEKRFKLVKLALDDFKEERYYASVLVVLSLIDGWVNDLNIVDFQRQGFFSEKSNISAWDSIAAHPSGLMKLKEVLSKTRLRTRTEEIRIPFRHGIIHGMDLGYNNRYTAAKCWVTLFAVREWAIKAAKDELIPPKIKPEVEKSLWESIEDYQRVLADKRQMEEWKPRIVNIGEDVQPNGEKEKFSDISPEQKMAQFLNFWMKKNYGYMAKCYAPMLGMKPQQVRESLAHLNLLDYKLVQIKHDLPFTADIEAQLEIETSDGKSSVVFEFRLVVNNKNGELAHIQSENTVWGVTTWRSINP